MLLIPIVGRWSLEDEEFKVIFCSTANSLQDTLPQKQIKKSVSSYIIYTNMKKELGMVAFAPNAST